TEFSYRSGRSRGGEYRGDASTWYPVCACIVYEDGRELHFDGTDGWAALREALRDERYTFVVHGCAAEEGFCRRLGIPFPRRYTDTLLMSVMLLHAEAHKHADRAYAYSGLADMAARYGIPHFSGRDKDVIRDSILRGTYLEEFGMPRVLRYCA